MTKRRLQAAKNRLSEMVRKASDEGPQDTLVDFFRKSPLGAVPLDLTRSRNKGRRVKL